jgi:isopentenyldiphosphate isomerase
MPSEAIVIVNKQDLVIGSKQRGTTTYDDIYRVAAVWLSNFNSEVLLAQRKWTKKNNPGKWGPAAAGTVGEGETYEENIYKEAEEEIGLSGVNFQLGPKKLVDLPPTRRYFCQWYTAQIDWPVERFRIQESEVEQIIWVSLRDLFEDTARHPEKYVESASNWKSLF